MELANGDELRPLDGDKEHTPPWARRDTCDCTTAEERMARRSRRPNDDDTGAFLSRPGDILGCTTLRARRTVFRRACTSTLPPASLTPRAPFVGGMAVPEPTLAPALIEAIKELKKKDEL